jgi:hypothetical protein
MRGFLGQYNATHRFVPDDSWAPGLVTITRDWAEVAALGQALKDFCGVADLPEAFADQLLERIVDQVLECYFQGVSLRSGSWSASDGMYHWFLAEPTFNKAVLESCEAVSGRYEASIDTAKRETIYLPMEGLQVFPAAELIPLMDDTTVIHLSAIPTPVLRRFLRDRRMYAIRGFPAYWVERMVEPVDTHRYTCSSSKQALEALERTVAAFRVAHVGWIAAPLGMVASSLPWNELRTVVANQNLPWPGLYDFRTDKDSAMRVAHYLKAIHLGKLPSLILDQPADANFAYLIWAMKQLRFMAEAANDSTRASHLFIAVDALFGEENNSKGNWMSLPKKLFHHSAHGYEDIAGVMEVAYDCRCDLVHKGVTPPQRFFQRHFGFMNNLIIATIGWILENQHLPELETKSGFIEYLRSSNQKRGPQAITTGLCQERFSARIS